MNFDDLLEGGPPIHQEVFVAAVAVPLPVAIVLVDEDLAMIGHERVGPDAAPLEDQLAGLLVLDEIEDVRALGRRVFGVRVIDVVACAVHQRLVAGDVLLLIRRVLLAVGLEPLPATLDRSAAANGTWRFRQVLDDPKGYHDWAIEGTVDLASAEAGDAVIQVQCRRRAIGLRGVEQMRICETHGAHMCNLLRRGAKRRTLYEYESFGR